MKKLRPIKRVAVVDDDDDAALTIIHTLEDAGFQPYRVDGASDIGALVASIVADSDAAICDHRLRYGGFADVAGAELAAALVEQDHPTILVTQYLDQYADIAIRSFRSNLPVVLRREDADEPSELRLAFARCKVELIRGKIKERKLQKTLLEVKDVSDVGDVKVIDAIVNGWNPKDTVRFPMSLVREEDREHVVPSTILSALSNVSTDEKVDLYFERVEIAPEPDDGDGLQ
jgi:CheY-like chemotaxis protein